MSWDIFVQDIPPSITSIQDIPDDFQPSVIGARCYRYARGTYMTKPIMIAEDKTFLEGYIGFGSFDDTGKVDNVRIWCPESKEKKGKIFPEAAAK